jgi:hypothetical protein
MQYARFEKATIRHQQLFVLQMFLLRDDMTTHNRGNHGPLTVERFQLPLLLISDDPVDFLARHYCPN